MSDQLIQGCVHEWSAENVKVLVDRPSDHIEIYSTTVMVICTKCYVPKPPIDLSKPPSEKRLLTDSK